MRVLSLATRTGDWMSRPSSTEITTTTTLSTVESSPADSSSCSRVSSSSNNQNIDALLAEFEAAEEVAQKTLAAHPAMVRPTNLRVMDEEVTRDFMILDNSLREPTVGAPKGHSLDEKYQILQALIDNTGIQEVILGSYGTKVSVDSQIAH